MLKAELIEKYGPEWYEEFKEKERKRRRKRYAADPTYTKNYNKANAEVYRINSRDRNRFMLMGVELDGKVVHHFAYHKDKNDTDWINDIAIMTRDEHQAWHEAHPDFIAREHIV